MSSAFFTLGIILVPIGYVMLIADKQERSSLCILMLLAGLFFLSVLWQIDEAIPFVGGGDDKDYFNVSKRSFNNISQWFDLRQFKQTHEQAGYPLILSWVHQFVGGSLYHRKAVNIFFFLMLALVWFEIGKQIGGRHFGFVCALGILLATPLWFYWIFLFKDMVITLLQSMFILGLIRSLSSRSLVKSYGLIGLSTVLTIPFRSKLALVNLVALAGTSLLRSGSRRSWKDSLWRITMMGGLILTVLVVGRNPEVLHQLGVAGEHRSLDTESLQAEFETRGRSRSSQFTNVVTFPLLYLVGEVAAFNPKSWEGEGASLIRGLSMVPWIYVGVPLFVTGTWTMLRRQKYQDRSIHMIDGKTGESPTDTTIPERAQLVALLVFVLIYAGVAWGSGDTTRWRMPAMPPMVAIAGFSWVTMNKHQRFTMLSGWGLALSIFLMIYYSVLR